MITKHFFKTLIIFAGMILLGLLGIVLVSQFGQKQESTSPNTNSVAK